MHPIHIHICVCLDVYAILNIGWIVRSSKRAFKVCLPCISIIQHSDSTEHEALHKDDCGRGMCSHNILLKFNFPLQLFCLSSLHLVSLF